MNIYQTNAVTSLHTGHLLLNAKQAARRAHLLEKVEAKITLNDDEKEFLNAANETLAVYTINKPVQFKSGERIGYDGEIPKAERMAFTALDDVEEPADNNSIDEALLAAIAQLEPGNADHWTSQGKPEIKALANILQRKVTGKERDMAFAFYQEFGTGEESTSAIADDLLSALASLDTQDDNNYEEDGTPKLTIISEQTGREVSADELNAALDAIDNTTEQND